MKKFRLDFEHFNLLSGLKRVFGTQAIWGGVKALLKASVVGLVLYSVVQGLVPVLLTAGGLPVCRGRAGRAAAASPRWSSSPWPPASCWPRPTSSS